MPVATYIILVNISNDVISGECSERINRLFEEQCLKLDYIHMPLENYQDLSSADNQTRKISVETVKLAIIACQELGGSSVVIHASGRKEIGINQMGTAIAGAVASANELLEFAEGRDVGICLENLTANFDWQEVTLALMDDPKLSSLELCIDPCHAMIASDDPLALVRKMAPRTTTTHFSDTMGEHDSHLIPGEGAVDYNGVARELGLAGYNGVVDLECSLWMERKRKAKGQTHPGDCVPCSTENYLEKCAAAAKQIATNIEKTR